MLIDPTWEPRALAAHAAMPQGNPVLLPASRDEEDHELSPNEAGRMTALRSYYRLAGFAKALGMSQRQYLKAKKAGTLPAWAMRRAPRCDRKERV